MTTTAIQRRGFAAALALLALLLLLSACTGSSSHSTPAASFTPQAGSAQPASAPSTAAPAPVPSPAGTVTGACDYTLGNDPAGDPSTAVATGDIEVANTGNIGTIVRLVITWPQQGYSSLKETRTVRVTAGDTQDIQFNRPLTSTELDNLQSWQLGHAGDTGCTYDGTITGTFGTAQ